MQEFLVRSCTIECSVEEFNNIVDDLNGVFYGLKFVSGNAKTGGGVCKYSTWAVWLEYLPWVHIRNKTCCYWTDKTIAGEYGRENIRINAIAPGTNETPMVRRTLKGY